jgi:hypothetical protein
MGSTSSLLLGANINGGKRGIFDHVSSIVNDTDISSSLPPKFQMLHFITGAMEIMISPSCLVSYVHLRRHNNCMSGRINLQPSQYLIV